MWKLHDTFTVCYNMTMFRKTEEIQIKSWRCFRTYILTAALINELNREKNKDIFIIL